MTSSTPPTATAKTPRRARTWAWCLALLFLIAAVPLLVVDWTPADWLQQRAASALQRGDFSELMTLGQRLMKRPAHRATGMLYVAESYCRSGRFDDALQLLEQVPADQSNLKVTAELLTARILCDDLHRPGDAEGPLRNALRVDPSSLVVHEKLAMILGLAGRSWEAAPHRLALISQDDFSLQQLNLLALGSTAIENPEVIAEFAAISPEDLIVLCGRARGALRDERIDEGERLLDSILSRHPALLCAQAWKGEVLLHRGDQTKLAAWQTGLPAGADDFPDIWFVRASWAAQQNQLASAARCYWECLQRDPIHLAACYQLATVLTQLGEAESAEVYRQHSRLLGDLITAARTVEISGTLEPAVRAAEACESLGLMPEAWAWRRASNRSGSGFTWNPESSSRPRPESGSPRIDVQHDPTKRVNLSSYPLPPRSAREVTEPGKRPDISGDRIRFLEQARAVGIEFQYRNGSRPETDSEFMYEFSGGGVAAVDYDADGWPDLYLTQGSDQPPYVAQDVYFDRLFRNNGDGLFSDVTSVCGIRETGFSQGCAAGDYDNDGFTDLFVANIGSDRLYHNNGDGTFSEVTVSSGIKDDRWTTSCAIVDLNGDGNPDIYAANYVSGKDVLTKPCRMPDGSTRLCTPHEFAAEHDQLYLSLGDGRFEDQSSAAGIEVPDGKGLGVVAASYDNSGRIGLFVANDTVPNFHFLNTSSQRGGAVQFEEVGYRAGLAVNGDGQALASMGVAVGDPNGDGRLDVYVSTFRNEPKTLYVQLNDGIFVDATRQSGLREPSLTMLGFGTQFLDADLDGWEDLVLTNGHVGNLKHHGIAYEMPPQFFHNLGKGRFAELPAATLGAFFAGQYLGRGLARLDWNRDGLDDFAVSHLKSPAALVTNQTSRAGKFLSVQLRGVESDRDAIGARVTVSIADRQLVRQLTAGDGYQASNQRQLIFGLGDTATIDELKVQWPSRRTQSFQSVSLNSTVLLIEGRSVPVVLTRP